MTEQKISWEEIESACKAIHKQTAKNKYDAIVCVATGGLIPGKILSELFHLPLGVIVSRRYGKDAEGEEEWFLDTNIKWMAKKLNPAKILVVDDIISEGKTMEKIIQRFKSFTNITKPENLDVCALFFKKGKFKVNIKPHRIYFYKETDDWIVFPWEIANPKKHGKTV